MEKALTVNGRKEAKLRYESQMCGLNVGLSLVNLNIQGFLGEGGEMDV